MTWYQMAILIVIEISNKHLLTFQLISERVVKLYDDWVRQNRTTHATRLGDLDETIYRDSDVPSLLPDDLYFSP